KLPEESVTDSKFQIVGRYLLNYSLLCITPRFLRLAGDGCRLNGWDIAALAHGSCAFGRSSRVFSHGLARMKHEKNSMFFPCSSVAYLRWSDDLSSGARRHHQNRRGLRDHDRPPLDRLRVWVELR